MNLKNVLILLGISAIFIIGGITYSKIASKKLKKNYNKKEEIK